MKKRDFKNQRIWITGASSGIGAALVAAFAEKKAQLIISGRNIERLQLIKAQYAEQIISIIPFDVTEATANHRAVEQIKELGGLDVAIFNAGDCEYIDIKNFDRHIFEQMIKINFLSIVYGIEAVLPLLRASKQPYLVGMSSATAYGGLPCASAYGASKAAVRNMLESLRFDLLEEKIPVSVICPGFVQTPLTDRNTFTMPTRIPAEKAAQHIVASMECEQPEIHFPWQLIFPYKFVASLPSRWYTWIITKVVGKAGNIEKKPR